MGGNPRLDTRSKTRKTCVCRRNNADTCTAARDNDMGATAGDAVNSIAARRTRAIEFPVRTAGWYQYVKRTEAVWQQLTKLSSTSFPHHSSTNSAYTHATPVVASPSVLLTVSYNVSFARFSSSTRDSPAASGVRCRVAESLIAAGREGRVLRRRLCR